MLTMCSYANKESVLNLSKAAVRFHLNLSDAPFNSGKLDNRWTFTLSKLCPLNAYVALTTLWVCVCPTRINMFEQIIDKQKLSRIIDRSERIYL